MRFWSLCRLGVVPVEGRASFRAFRAAVSVCGLPRPFVRVERPRQRPYLSLGLDFYGPVRGVSGDLLFRCSFTLDLFRPRDASW